MVTIHCTSCAPLWLDTAMQFFEEQSQGEGGAFAVGKDVVLTIRDSKVTGNSAGKQVLSHPASSQWSST